MIDDWLWNLLALPRPDNTSHYYLNSQKSECLLQTTTTILLDIYLDEIER
jgi:hypothetical protein